MKRVIALISCLLVCMTLMACNNSDIEAVKQKDAANVSDVKDVGNVSNEDGFNNSDISSSNDSAKRELMESYGVNEETEKKLRISMSTDLPASKMVTSLKNEIIDRGQKIPGGYCFSDNMTAMGLLIMYLTEADVCTFTSDITFDGVNVVATLVISETEIPAVILKYDEDIVIACNYPQPDGGINVIECKYENVEDVFLQMLDLSYTAFDIWLAVKRPQMSR